MVIGFILGLKKKFRYDIKKYHNRQITFFRGFIGPSWYGFTNADQRVRGIIQSELYNMDRMNAIDILQLGLDNIYRSYL